MAIFIFLASSFGGTGAAEVPVLIFSLQ